MPLSKHQELLTLEDVKGRFEDWRCSRDRMGKIPDDLRSDAASLTERYSKTDIIRELRLNGSQLRHFLTIRQKSVTSPTPSPSFLEIPLPPAPVHQPPCPVELKNAKGLTLRLQNCSEHQFSKLLQTFMSNS